MMDPKFHIPVGQIWLSPTGVSDDVFVGLSDGKYKRLDRSCIEALLSELGVPVEKNGWSSWERDGWEIEGDLVHFYLHLGTATPDPTYHETRIPVDVLRATLLLVRCPCRSTSDSIKLRGCRTCIFSDRWMDYGKCRHGAFQLGPVHDVLAEFREYVSETCQRYCGQGTVKSSMQFRVLNPDACIPSNWQRLINGLSSSRSMHVDEKTKRILLQRRWPHTGGVNHEIRLDPVTHEGTISSEETIELYSNDDWHVFKSNVNSKTHHILRAFAEACWWTWGEIEPIRK